MKKLLTTLTIILCFALVGKAQYVNIPDSNFRNFLQSKYPTAFNGAGQMDTSNTLIVNASTVNCYTGNSLKISSIEGIQYFRKLTKLNCANNNITSLPTLPDNLLTLNITLNLISALPNLPVHLRDFRCGSNKLTSLPNLPDTLRTLLCYSNELTSLPNLPNTLRALDCSYNLLTSLPNLPRKMDTVNCANNTNLSCLPFLPDSSDISQFILITGNTNIKCMPNVTVGMMSTALPVCNTTNNTNNCPTFGSSLANYVNIPDTNFGAFLLAKYPTCLYKDTSNKYWMDTTCGAVLSANSIDCSPNNSPYIPIRDLEGVQYFKSLQSLNCFAAGLYHLRQLPKGLTYLKCSGTLDSLPALPSTLTYLDCSYSDVHWLPTLPQNLQWLDCSGNPLNGGLPALPNSLKQLYCEKDSLTSIPRLPDSLQTFDCNNNPHLNCLPYLPSTLDAFGFSYYNTNIKCLPNKPSGISGVSLPVCNSTNNPNNCPLLNFVNIPDTNFGKFLIAQYPACLYKDASNMYWMDTTCGAVVSEDSLDCSNKQIRSIAGIEYFKKLKFLYAYFNSINSISLLPDSLQELWLINNLLSGLPSLPKGLKLLSCDNNNITTLPMLPDSLRYLVCNNNQLTALPVLPAFLTELKCSNNHLTTLPTLGDSISQLLCNNNLLTSLPKLPLKLFNLKCQSNYIYCLPHLPSNLYNLTIDHLKIKCIPNVPPFGLSIFDSIPAPFPNQISVPVCNPTNNPNNCQIYPTVSGKVFTDNNSNATKDTAEFYRPLIAVGLSNGQTAYTNLQGEYNITVDTFGTYTLKVTPPPFYKAVPDSFNVTFGAGGLSVVLPDIALQPLQAIDSYAVKIVNYNMPRPRRKYAYAVAYANAGTTTDVNDNLVRISFGANLHFDSVSSTVASAVTFNMPNEFDINVGKLLPGQFGGFNVYFTVDSTANIGDTVKTTAAIIYKLTKTFDINKQPVVNSYDPNDKQATPQLTVQQVQKGDYIDYIIRFQNTGTAQAINIVIEDSLSNFLLTNVPGAVNILPASHNCLGYRSSNGKAYFEFYGINLPDSNTNEALSHGFMHFQIKAQPTLSLGTIIPNQAKIVFDYNKSIATNIATTEIKNIIVPVRILEYKTLYNNEKRETRNAWKVGAEINVLKYVVERSVDGKEFTSIGTVAAKGLNEYQFTDNSLPFTVYGNLYYRIKIVDKDNKVSYSEIRTVNHQPLTVNSIALYPNPAKNKVTIETDNAKKVEVIDGLGRVVMTKEIFNTQYSTFNIQYLNKGIYLVKMIMNDGEIKLSKLVIE